ncbi:MAG: DNA mismatch repair endonuclease MutL [Candidatus Eutrophobiaceae bacterium]
MQRIHLLPERIADQIAAGEVIERPASVVKELLENALDAGATEVIVDIASAGSGLIKIQDNGHGIHCKDLPLALTRHATSKLRSLDDLQYIVSLGFRGEALPSIASVSRLAIASRSREHDRAWRIDAKGEEPKPCSHLPGTTIEVRDLFYNTPARRKFLKSNQTELNHIRNATLHIALSCHGTRVVLRNEGREIFRCRSAADRPDQRVREALGKNFMDPAQEIRGEWQEARLQGWILPASCARSQSNWQFFYVNGRLIRDQAVTHAIRRACGDAVPQGRHVCYLLYLEIDPALVDVNVHPTKREVRFRDRTGVYNLIYGTINAAFSSHLFEVAKPPTVVGEGAAPAAPLVQERPMFSKPEPAAGKARSWSAQPQDHLGSLGRPSLEIRDLLIRPGKEWQMPDLFALPGHRHALRFEERGMMLIDIRGARRLLCERQLLDSIKQGNVVVHRLPMPVIFPATPAQVALIEDATQELAAAGLLVESFGPAQLALRGFPKSLAYANLQALLNDLMRFLESKTPPNLPEDYGRLLATHVNDSLGGALQAEELDDLDKLIHRYAVEVEQCNAHLPWRLLVEADWDALLK